MKHVLTALAATGTVMMVASATQAAVTASFGSATAINSNDDIINPGNVIEAINFGPDGEALITAVSVGGNTVNFNLANNGTAGGVTNGGAFFASDSFFVDDNPAAGTVGGDNDSEFHSVLDSFGDNNNFVYTFNGLSAGTYYLQAFHSDDRGNRSGVSFDIVVDPGQLSEDLVGSFSYDSNNDTFRSAYVVAEIELTGGSDSFSFQRTNRSWNAIVLTQIPEPGSLALMGLGGLVMLHRRR